MNINIEAIIAAQYAGHLAASAARMGGLSAADVERAYNAAYDTALNDANRRMQTTELGKIERSTAQKIQEMNEEHR